MGNTSRPDFLSRRACLYAGAALALGTALSLHRESTEAAESAEPIRPASAGVWRPTIDLNFSESGGLAQWWVPELVLLGNTDVSLSARGPTEWSRDGEFLTYHDQKTDGRRDIFRMSLVKGQKQIERTPRHQQKWGFTKRLSDDGIFGVVSKDRSTVLTTHWRPTHHRQANLKRTFSCIHANPQFGAIAPGESRARHGCVLLSPGNLDDAWKETQTVMNSF